MRYFHLPQFLRSAQTTWIILACLFFSIAAQAQTGFGPAINERVNAIAIQPDGKIVIGGFFTRVNNITRNYIARLNADGSLDTNFNPGADNAVLTLSIQPDGKIIAGGHFQILGGSSRKCIARLNADGSLDANFHPDANGPVLCLAIQPDDKIVVGGLFTIIGGSNSKCLARLNANGTVDRVNNNLSLNPVIQTLGLLPSGKIVVGGSFLVSTLPKTNQNVMVFNSDLTVSSSFTLSFNDWVNCLAVQPDGKIIAGGDFASAYNTTGGTFTRSRLARFDETGAMDASFTPSANDSVSALSLQADGGIWVGGYFSTLAGQGRSRLGRLSQNGAIDSATGPIFAGKTILAIPVTTLQSDGSLLMALATTTMVTPTQYELLRLTNATTAVQSLTASGSQVKWLRSGGTPQIDHARFDVSTNGVDWMSLGNGTPVSGGWQVAINPALTNFPLRARGYVNSAGSGSLMKTTSWGDFRPRIISNTGALASGHFGFDLAGLDGETVILEGSANLKSWSPLTTNTFTTTPIRVTDSGSVLSSRFYRLRSP